MGGIGGQVERREGHLLLVAVGLSDDVVLSVSVRVVCMCLLGAKLLLDLERRPGGELDHEQERAQDGARHAAQARLHRQGPSVVRQATHMDEAGRQGCGCVWFVHVRTV